MKSALYEWIRNIAFYMILSGIILNILPKSNLEKYVKLVTGLILMLLVINPIMKLMDVEKYFDTAFLKNMYSQEISVNTQDILNMSDKYQETVFNEYEDQISLDISDMMQEVGLYTLSVKVSMQQDSESENYGEIIAIDINGSKKPQDIKMTQEIEGNEIVIENIETKISDNVKENTENESETSYESYEVVKIKKMLVDFYNVAYGNININIQG